MVQIKLRQIMSQLTWILQPRKIRNAKNEQFLESLSPVGVNPLDMTCVYKTWAGQYGHSTDPEIVLKFSHLGPDDCDFNFHLSNSCYAKVSRVNLRYTRRGLTLGRILTPLVSRLQLRFSQHSLPLVDGWPLEVNVVLYRFLP